LICGVQSSKRGGKKEGREREKKGMEGRVGVFSLSRLKCP